MKRRFESTFASGALLLLLSMTLLYGCRAFDPEPVVVNRAPDTFVTGAPAETTGAGFRRHMFWYGTDKDGEVVQFIYAITDSIARDIDEPTEDEENALFNPADDVTTLRDSNIRRVGWTTKSDSVFSFVIDRGANPSKEITFHIVAVDDRGAIDPTPARLRFFNNSLGNPVLQFRVYVGVGPDGTGGELRWVGTPFGPDASSPEQTSRPFIGFRQPFRIEWEGSSPNFNANTGRDGIVGYRVKTRQGPGAYTPPLAANGKKQWSRELTSAVYLNERPASDPAVGSNCNGETGVGCDPTLFRFPSGPFDLTVEVVDEILVESLPAAGFLRFEVNYPPETQILTDASTPSYRVVDSGGVELASGVIAAPSGASLDTVPVGAFVTIRSSGYDRFPDSVPPGEGDLLCCDISLEAAGDTAAVQVPEVRYQTRLTTVRRQDSGDAGIPFTNVFSSARANDDITFAVGPLDYEVISRTVDEHRRPDPSPSTFEFVAGFRPRIDRAELVPGPVAGDTLLLRYPLFGQPPTWPDNEVVYSVQQGVSRWFVKSTSAECGGQLLTQAPTSGVENTDWKRFPGDLFRFRPRFVGEPDPRDPLAAVRGWSYAFYSDADPNNDILVGRESRDLDSFVDSPQNNVWAWSETEAIEIWVPTSLWFTDGLFSPGSPDALSEGVGCLIRKQVGEFVMRVQARTTRETDTFDLYEQTRNDSTDAFVPLPIGKYGRKSDVVEYKYWVLLGVDLGAPSPTPDKIWPDF